MGTNLLFGNVAQCGDTSTGIHLQADIRFPKWLVKNNISEKPPLQKTEVFVRVFSYMKADIHPKFDIKVAATCASCGEKYVVGSTKENIEVEICANCHPFYTGTEKMTDTAGRVEKFRARKAAATPKKAK